MFLLKILTFLFIYDCPVYSFQKMKNKRIHTNLFVNDFNRPKQYIEESIGKLYEDINNNAVEKIYFSKDLLTAYSKKYIDDEYGNKYSNIYLTTNTNPLIVSNIIETANKNKIDTVILTDANSFGFLSESASILSKSFDLLFFPTLIIIFLRSFFMFNSRNTNSNNNFGGNNPFMPFGMNTKNPNADKINMQKANISLSSWAGSSEIFQECTEIVSYLQNNTLYKNAGAEIPKGILLEGPPGTGKTLIAKAIASEANATFISISASEFVELFVGMGASKVRNLFSTARNNAPCIIFIDEIDAVGRQRGTGINMGNDEREQTLNQLLAEMDGFAQNENIIVIAATNRKDVLDAALLRPGRFDRIINVPLPDRESRKEIFKVYLKNKKVNNDIQIDFLSEITAGFSGAQIKNLINEAAINAARLGNTIITQSNIEDALEKLIVGIVKKNDTRNNNTLRRIAIHEIGHAFLTLLYKEYFELKKVTIQNTYNGAGGYTIFNEYPEIIEGGLYTKDLLKKRIIVSMGGKAAESVFYGDNFVSLGAIQDIKQANNIAQTMIGNYGMGDKLKVFYNENIDANRNPFLGRSLSVGDRYSDKTKELFDKESMDLVLDAYSEAVYLIEQHKDAVNSLVNLLLEHRTLNGDFLTKMIKNYTENT